ncbi:unnamed protein product [Knipowitschia caucasica]|uniref:Polyisoprenoid diphosphate/phosphate phosphohydrolase PLPP6 n=1 Tax=Knipowitschia caucasica TaxID=637954 RepID=A0AAV2JTE0_KNICA
MSSSGFRRSSCRGGSCGARTPAEAHRRRSSSCFPPAPQADHFSLNQPLVSIALRLFLAVDLWLSKRLGVCSCEEAAWGSIRPLVRLVEFSGHAAPWLFGAVYSLLLGDSAEEKEIMLNLTLALLLDLMMVRLLKKMVRRRMPVQNRSDILSTFFVEKYSFPSGHATRAALCARFLMAQLVDTYSMRVLVLGWASLVSLSRLLLARHYVTDVGFGLAMGYCQYGLVERLWVSWDCLQDVLLLKVRESIARAYSQLWSLDWGL